jgi:penicillin G amidase
MKLPSRSALTLALTVALLAPLASHAQTMLTAPGLSARGEILYDAEGVPTVVGANDYDAAYLQGYAHARDRFWQMDFSRRAISGTLAELLGTPALANDVQTRTLGLRRAARETFSAMSDDTRAWMKAYADGVNYWLASNPLPPEYTALELTRAEPWQPIDSIVIGKALAFQLSFDLDIDRTLGVAAYQTAGGAGGFNGSVLYFEDVNRIAPPDDRVSVPGFLGSIGGRNVGDAKAAGEDMAPISAETVALAEALKERVLNHPIIGPQIDRKQFEVGSNLWLVAGREAVGGAALMANDPHLGHGVPSVFVEGRVISNDPRGRTNAVGVTIPGAPGVTQGCNENICWGTTTNSLDVTDTFQETVRLNSYGLPVATVFQGREEPITQVWQSYFVNRLDGVPDNAIRDNSIGLSNGGITFVVPRRNFGPILQLAGTTALSVQYTGWGPTFELESFRRINRAANVDQFRDALQFFDVGSQNFSYADRLGNIAYFTTAEMPLRDDLQNLNTADGGVPPFLIRDGSGTRRHEWMSVVARQPNQAINYEMLPFAEMPQTVNPASGYVANANNDPAGNTLDNNALNQVRPRGGIYYLDYGYAAYRQGRIDRSLQSLVARAEPVSAADMRNLQANTQMLDAELVLPFLTRALANAQATGAWTQLADLGRNADIVNAIGRLSRWDFSTPTGIREGFDAGDNPMALGDPSQAEIDASVAATLWSVWRGQVLRNVVDATFVRIGLANNLPGNDQSYRALKTLLERYPQRQGVGVSGVDFFVVAGAPNKDAARDFQLLKSMADSIALIRSEAFAPAFARSTNFNDYRWGRLHRVSFNHQLGGPFSIPGAPYGFNNLAANLPGLARAGGYETVDVAAHSLKANTVNGFTFGAGPARRAVTAMGASAIGFDQIIPGGQSGVLGSPLYASQLSRWLTNQYKSMATTEAGARAQTTSTITLNPRP